MWETLVRRPRGRVALVAVYTCVTALTAPGCRLRGRVALVAVSSWLEDGVLGVIVINTVLMGIDHNCDLCTQARVPAVMDCARRDGPC